MDRNRGEMWIRITRVADSSQLNQEQIADNNCMHSNVYAVSQIIELFQFSKIILVVQHRRSHEL